MKKSLFISKLDQFTIAYITALLWTTNEDEFPEYCYSGEFSAGDDDFMRFTLGSLESINADCQKFQNDNAALLELAGEDDQNGYDFALSRNGHGTGNKI